MLLGPQFRICPAFVSVSGNIARGTGADDIMNMGQVARKIDADTGRKATKPVVVVDLALVEQACVKIANGSNFRKAAHSLGTDAYHMWQFMRRSPEAQELYASARALRAQFHERKIGEAAKKLQDITDTNLDDETRIKAIAQEVKARQWLAKVSDPHMFGDRSIVEGGDKPLQVEHSLSPNEHARRIAFMLMQAAVQKPGAKNG